MKNKFFHCLCVMLVFFAMPVANARELSLKDVLQSSAAHYPKVKMALFNIDAAKGKLQAAEGGFDLRLDGDTKMRTSGYYDGDYGALRLVKPFAPLNSEVYVGYRDGDGDFPVYDDYLRTKSGGEVNVGVVFSLLRNRDYDERRFKLQDASYAFKLSEIDSFLTRLETQVKAQYAYGEWLAAGLIRKAHENALSLAKTRQIGIEGRIKAGDESEIAGVENRQNILKRTMMLNDAERDFLKKSNDLSLYWRDENGNPIIPSAENLPNSFTAIDLPAKSSIATAIHTVINARPELEAIKINIDQERANLKLRENNLLPKVDLSLEAAQDQGTGSENLGGTEGIVKLKLSVPLQQNLASGEITAANAKIRQLEQKEKLVSDTIKAELQNIVADYDAALSNRTLSMNELDLAKQMQAAELQLFNSGASNLFLINTREEKALEAEIKNIMAHLYLLKAAGNFYAATIQSEKFLIK